MTTPPPQQPPPQQSPQQRLANALAAILAGGALVSGAMATLIPLLAYLKIRREAMEAALRVVFRMTPAPAGFYGPATATVARLNLMRRVQFVIAAARRITTDLAQAQAHGEPLGDALTRGIAREARYYGQHLAANWARENAAAAVDNAASEHGLLLGWYAHIDAKTSLECWLANGRNFRADQMPPIGYPGAVHPSCRCEPGPPFPGAALVGGASVGARDRRQRRSVPDHRPVHHPA